MECGFCFQEKRDALEYCFYDYQLNICNECLNKIGNRLIQICNQCGKGELVATDSIVDGPTVIFFPCDACISKAIKKEMRKGAVKPDGIIGINEKGKK